MKLALIAVGLLATISQVPSAFARAAGFHGEDPWNPQHIGGLPAEVRTALARMCGGSRAQHQFASYFKIRGFLCCTLNTSAVAIAVRFAHKRAAYIRFMSRQVAAIGC
jgi:hypothetical protein